MVTDLSWTVKYTEYNVMVRCEDSRKQRIKLFLSKNNAIKLFYTLLHERSMKAVKTNKDDPPFDILQQEQDQIPEDVRHIRLKESPHVAQRAVGNNQRIDRLIRKITRDLTKALVVDEKFLFGQDPSRREIVAVKSAGRIVTTP